MISNDFTKYKDIMVDGFRYPLSDFRMIFILGLVLLAASFIEEHITDYTNNFYILIPLILLSLLSLILEGGYLLKVLQETIEGSNKLPSFTNYWSLIVHGTIEITVSMIYLSLPLLFILVSYVFLNVSKVTHSYLDMYMGLILLGTGMGIIFILTFFLQGVILNMAHHHGNIHSGFCWKKIIKRMRVIGFKNMILPYIITWIVLGSFYLFFVEQIKNIPTVGIYLSQMIITPYLIIFTMRVLGLVDRKFG